MNKEKWNAFRNGITKKTKVFKREDGQPSKSKNLYVIICAALVFSLILSAAIFAGQIKANKTAKETSKVIETVKTDTLSGTAFETSMKELNQDMAKELTGLGEYLTRLDKSVLENRRVWKRLIRPQRKAAKRSIIHWRAI